MPAQEDPPRRHDDPSRNELTDDVTGEPVDPVDAEAAEVDARSPKAAEQVGELVDDAGSPSPSDG
jgi:hypothetical protein